MSFSVELERRGDTAIAVMRGDLDIATEGEATAQLDQAMDGAELLVAYLRELSFLDSAGVRVLLAAHLRATEQGTRFAVARGKGTVARLLEVTRIDQRFPVVDDPDELL